MHVEIKQKKENPAENKQKKHVFTIDQENNQVTNSSDDELPLCSLLQGEPRHTKSPRFWKDSQ